MEERYYLAFHRISEIVDEKILSDRLQGFFADEAEFILFITKIYELKKNDELCKHNIEELRAINHRAYEWKVDITYANCLCAEEAYLCALDAEIKAMIPYAYEGDMFNLVIRMELFLEFYSAYLCAKEEGNEHPEQAVLKDLLFYYVNDYTYDAYEEKVRNNVTLEEDFATRLILNEDVTDIKTLYLFGEYVTDVEEDTLKHVANLPYETLKKMADTFTEGYRIGFIATNKDLSIKKTVAIRYSLGFEPMIKIAIENFRDMGLKPTFTRASFNLLKGRGVVKNGYQGACPSRQYDYEHKDDAALFLDSRLATIKVEALKSAYEKYKKEASFYAGPAVMEVFGEAAPEYVTVPMAPVLSAEQQKLKVKITSESMNVQNEYIKEEERSFTIISFPTPQIGPEFTKIFDEVVTINTLDYKLYQRIQQTMIDTLDKGDYVIVKGCGENKTNLKVSLHKLANPDKETIFENCVADVNIPVGEVFTSPVLKGTEGILHVKKVFLNGLEYKDFMLTITDGVVTEYTCKNFPTEEENKKYIKDNVLFAHDTLPMGEFAIGTNTTAYTMARKYNIEDKMPILIAEKTGPHFAFGDTCYSLCEEVRVYNPDGKEIVAKENDFSLLRHEDPLKAYFNCHTDVTIPYDELSEISVVTMEGEVITIIEDGKFTLSGTEELNQALM